MMRRMLDRLGMRAADTILVGDRMDTDVVAGLEASIEIALVLSGVTKRATSVGFRSNPIM
jgi:NagD protein